MRLIIGNKAYSSWSLRGWLACRLSGLPFEEVVVPLFDDAWDARRLAPDLAASRGQVPVLHGDGWSAWNSLGLVTALDGLVGGFWPADPRARAHAVSIAAEMQGGFAALRSACPMNVRRRYPNWRLPDAATADAERVDTLWRDGLARFGGPWLAGPPYGAADLMFAPVASRFTTYAVPLSTEAEAYRAHAMAHPWMAEWIAAAHAEPWRLDRYEFADDATGPA